ncbi:hypothetical protein B0H11DRAFT_2161975 [Mycena galericulata]|nr:hypothetical protein B0H11DRAFT_2161975 [Mycena galericulata]
MDQEREWEETYLKNNSQGELEHRRVERFYARTNKNTAVRQMTVLERREQALLRISRKPKKAQKKRQLKKMRPYVDLAESESLPYTAPEEHHHISHSRNFPSNILQFLNKNDGDPATHQGYMPKLKGHLLDRLLHPDSSWCGDDFEFTPEQHHKILIKNNRFYRHKPEVLPVNYTTYDVRRGQDSINQPPEGDTSRPFSYARIVGIFHVEAVNNTPGAYKVPTLIDVLWVRNFRIDKIYRAGFKAKRLHRLEFLPSDDPKAFTRARAVQSSI